MISAWVIAAAVACGSSPSFPPYSVPGPYFRVPVRLNPQSDGAVVGVQIFASSDRGRTWHLYADIAPDAGSFLFEAPHQGEYWFAPRLRLKEGQYSPPEGAPLAPQLRVWVAAGSNTRPADVAGLDDELTRLEVELIRKEMKRLAAAGEFTHEVTDQLDRLRHRIQLVRDRAKGKATQPQTLTGPLGGSCFTSAPPVIPPAVCWDAWWDESWSPPPAPPPAPPPPPPLEIPVPHAGFRYIHRSNWGY